MAPPRKKIKQEIKTEPFEEVWMEQDVSNMSEEKEIKRENYSEIIGEAGSGVPYWTIQTAIAMMPDQKAQCQICKKIYSEKSHAQRHYRNDHMTMVPTPCVICKTEFKNNEKYNFHLKKIHNVSMKQVKEAKTIQMNGQDFLLAISPDQVICSKCNTTISSVPHAKRHYRSKHNAVPEPEFSKPVQTIKQEPVFMETYAAGDFDNTSNADNENDHKDTGGDEDINEDNPGFLILSNGKVQCPNCQKSLSNMGNAKNHFSMVHDQVKVDCQLCKKSFKNAWYRDKHIKTSHNFSSKDLDLKKIVKYGEKSGFLPLPNRQVQCLKCQKILSNMGNAKNHFQMVHDEVKVNCQICEQSCKNAWYRDQHIKKDHGKSARALNFETIKMNKSPTIVDTFSLSKVKEENPTFINAAGPSFISESESPTKKARNTSGPEGFITKTIDGKIICMAPNCGKEFTRIDNAKVHAIKKHSPDEAIECPLCKHYCAKNSYDFNEHARKVHQMSAHDMKNLQILYSSINPNDPILAKRPDGKVSCLKCLDEQGCHKTFTRIDNAKVHFNKIHGQEHGRT